MRVAKVGRDEQVGQSLAARLVPRPAETLLAALVPADHHAVGVHHHDRVERGVEHGLQTGVKEPP